MAESKKPQTDESEDRSDVIQIVNGDFSLSIHDNPQDSVNFGHFTLEEIASGTDLTGTYERLKGIVPNLFDGSNIKRKVSREDCEQLISHFCCNQDVTAIDALLVLQRLASFSNFQVELLFEFFEVNLLDGLSKVLKEDINFEVLIEACRLVSIIMNNAGYRIIKAFVESGIISSVEILALRADMAVRQEACKVLCKAVSYAMLRHKHDLISVMIEQEWFYTFTRMSKCSDKVIQSVCLKGFGEILDNYHFKVSNLNVDMSNVKTFDPAKILEEGGDPAVISHVVFKIHKGVERLWLSRYSDIRNDAFDCMDSFWMRSVPRNQLEDEDWT